MRLDILTLLNLEILSHNSTTLGIETSITVLALEGKCYLTLGPMVFIRKISCPDSRNLVKYIQEKQACHDSFWNNQGQYLNQGLQH